eukprot:6127741-Alexandrium_andersonii.AAC.1
MTSQKLLVGCPSIPSWRAARNSALFSALAVRHASASASSQPLPREWRLVLAQPRNSDAARP